MISQIVIENFKSFKQLDLKLGALNLFIGTNASGKSNFLDALRVLQGIGNGFTISEIFDGKAKSATIEVWEGIRGGSAKACFADGSDPREVLLKASGILPGGRPWVIDRGDGSREVHPQGPGWELSVRVSPQRGWVSEERLRFGKVMLYDSIVVGTPQPTDPFLEVRYHSGAVGRQPHLTVERSRPVLAQFATGAAGRGKQPVKPLHIEKAARLARLLSNTQRLDPSPTELRRYSQAHQIQRMGEHGENFAALVHTLCADPQTKDAYVSWLRQLRPAEVDDVGTLSGALGEPLFMLREGNKEFPAPVLSDGTLRFAAITAALFQPDMPAVMTIEEIENGVHASRLRLLVELLRNRAATGTTQFMVTTHSPIVLAWLKPEEYAHTFFCKRDEATGESRICPLTEVPHFMEVVKRQPISDLFAEGWLETAL